MARKHRFEPYKEEIADLLGQGKTFREVEDYLYAEHGINAPQSELSLWCGRNGIRNLIESGRHNNPSCIGCENYLEIGSKFRKRGNVRVCKACLEEIHYNVPTSPEWCPKRKGGD